MTQGPSGVGGWLLFLVVSLTILSPLRGLGDTAREFQKAERGNPALAADEGWSRYKLATWSLVAASGALSVVAGVRLWTDHRSASVVFAVVTLWLIQPASSLLHMLAEWVIFNPAEAGEVLRRGLTTAAISSAGAGVWTAYLLLSRRVRNTYVDD